MSAYLHQVRSIAERAVREAGLAGSAVRPGPLFDLALRPMQAAHAEIALPDGPVLAVIEDETAPARPRRR